MMQPLPRPSIARPNQVLANQTLFTLVSITRA